MEKECKCTGWKIAFWIFFILFALETVLIGYGYDLAMEDERLETECSYDVCKMDKTPLQYEAYAYAYGMCYCYIDGKAVYTEYIK